MKSRILILIVSGLFAGMPSQQLSAASRLAFYYQQLEASSEQDEDSVLKSFPLDEFGGFAHMNWREEIPILRTALQSSRPFVRFISAAELRAAAGYWRSPEAIEQLRSLVSLMEDHYNDPVPENRGNDKWKDNILGFIRLTRASPSSGLIKNMLASLDDPRFTEPSAGALAGIKPLPVSIRDVLLSKMRETPYARAVILDALGEGGVDDPSAVREMTSSLTFSSPDADAAIVNSIHRAAAESLGKIGAAAQSAIPDLLLLLQKADEDSFTKEVAEASLRHIESTVR